MRPKTIWDWLLEYLPKRFTIPLLARLEFDSLRAG